MLFQVKQLLNEEALAAADRVLAAAPFVAGAAARPADGPAKPVLYADRPKTADIQTLDSMIVKAITGHPVIRGAALPKIVLTPLYCRHEPGMDAPLQQAPPLIGDPGQIRSDVAVAVFLSAPETYDGGELVLQSGGEEARVKLARGSAVVYDASFFHRVLPVGRGTRLTAMTWLQSLVKDASQREILFELDRVARTLNASAPTSDAARLTVKSYGNLFRMWAEV